MIDNTDVYKRKWLNLNVDESLKYCIWHISGIRLHEHRLTKTRTFLPFLFLYYFVTRFSRQHVDVFRKVSRETGVYAGGSKKVNAVTFPRAFLRYTRNPVTRDFASTAVNYLKRSDKACRKRSITGIRYVEFKNRDASQSFFPCKIIISGSTFIVFIIKEENRVNSNKILFHSLWYAISFTIKGN